MKKENAIDLYRVKVLQWPMVVSICSPIHFAGVLSHLQSFHILWSLFNVNHRAETEMSTTAQKIAIKAIKFIFLSLHHGRYNQFSTNQTDFINWKHIWASFIYHTYILYDITLHSVRKYTTCIRNFPTVWLFSYIWSSSVFYIAWIGKSHYILRSLNVSN